MELTDLDHDQLMALLCLMEAVALANGLITEGEERRIDRIATELGDDRYRRLLEEADKKFAGLDDLKTFLRTIENKGARDLIYGTVWEESIADPDIDHGESELLSWLSQTWGIAAKDD